MNLLGFSVDVSVVNIGISMAGIGISLLLFIATVYEKLNSKKETLYMILIVASHFVIFVVDTLFYIEQQDALFSAKERLYSALDIAFTLVILFSMNMYMIYRLNKKAYVSENIIYTLAGIYGLLCIVFCVGIGEETDWFYIITETGEMYATTAMYIFSYVEMLMMIFNIALLISCRKEIAKEELYSWLAVFGLPLFSYFFYRFTYIDVYNLFVLCSLVLMYVTIHNRDVIERKEMEKALVESNAKLMVSQIQPHFLYNSLNSIYYLIGEDPAKAQDALATFSNYLRSNVNALKNNYPVSIEEELNHTKAYLDLEVLRFGDKIKVHMDIQAKSFFIPPLTVQPLAENAVKYGLSSTKDGGNLYIKTYEDKRNYYVEVADDGVGFAAEEFKDDKGGESTHVGLYNVYSRLKNMMGGKLRVISEPGKGTKCIVYIPKKRAQN